MSRSESLRQLARARAESGHPVGLTPAGYHALPNGKLVRDEAFCSLFKQAGQMIVDGASLAEACTFMNGHGARSQRGRFLSRQSLHAMLRNPFYAGFIRYDGKLYRGAHEYVFTLDEFAALNNALRLRRVAK